MISKDPHHQHIRKLLETVCVCVKSILPLDQPLTNELANNDIGTTITINWVVHHWCLRKMGLDLLMMFVSSLFESTTMKADKPICRFWSGPMEWHPNHDAQ